MRVIFLAIGLVERHSKGQSLYLMTELLYVEELLHSNIPLHHESVQA